MSPERFDCELQHGITLTIESPSKAGLRDVAAFLAHAMTQFKEHRKTGNYSDGPYSEPIVKRGRPVASCTVAHSGDAKGTYLTADLWTDALVKAYTNADTLLQMIAALPAYQQASAADPGGWIAQALALLNTPHGELKALAYMIQRQKPA